jgi:peptidoglycan hydrolase-like protein with peptidoglycan-binding domain
LKAPSQAPTERGFIEALAQWQAQQGISADGILGPDTWKKMQPALASSGTQPGGAPTPASADLPTRLGTLVYRRDGKIVFSYCIHL